MGFRLLAALAAAIIGLAGSSAAVEVKIAPDRMLLVDGVRTFVIGLYEYPADDAVLDQVARAGFNLVHASEDTATLDRLHSRGLYAWINTGGRIELGPNAGDREAQLTEMAAQFGSHPSLLVWEGPDECLWMLVVNALRTQGTAAEILKTFNEGADALSSGLSAGYRKLRELDPHHPVWLNHAAGNSLERLAQIGQAADIVGADIYPLMPYPTQPIDYSRCGLGWVGSCTSRMQSSAPDKPVWMVLQGMSWGSFENDVFTLKPQPGQWPTFEESRFMAYDAIVRGARGVLYWGTHYLEKDSECWNGILEVVRELADNQPLLTAPDSPIAPIIETRILGVVPIRMKNPPLGVQVLGKEMDGHVNWIIANEYFFPVTYTLRGLERLEGATYSESGTGRQVSVRNGALTLPIPSYGVHILRPSDT